ncbi:MAG: nucleoside monophosphate kinase [Rickettsiales bacterium]|jgi:adenylate kinase|nr:nucleoside monophosphate kinase [Rickettsiales bacterium]
MKNKLIILAGMPGAGKGDNSEHLGRRPNTVSVSTGELFRALDPAGELGMRVASIINTGGLVSDDIVNQMVAEKLVPGGDIVLDGYPRSIPQAEWLLGHAAGMPFEIIAILLEIDEKIAEQRRDSRIAKALANGETPRKDDADSSALSRRFAEYYEKTAPMVKFLRQKLGDNFYNVDASVSVEEVYAAVENIVSGEIKTARPDKSQEPPRQ